MKKKQSSTSENSAAEQGAKPGMFIPIPTAEITNAAETARKRAEKEAEEARIRAEKEAEEARKKAEREAKEKADKEAADAVVALIRAIGVVEYTDACLEKINAAKQAYVKLTADQKKFVDNADVITTSEKEYDKLKIAAEEARIRAEKEAEEARIRAEKEAEAARKKTEKEAKERADKKAADAVVALIRAIGVVEYTDACRKKIEAAKQAYIKLTADQKKLVENADVLTASEDKYNDFQKAEEIARKKAAEAARKKAEKEAKERADKQAIEAVEAKIDAIGNVSENDACFQRINSARRSFDALSADQKKLVSNTSSLMKAEERQAKFIRKKEEQMLRVQIGKDSGDRLFLQEYCKRVGGNVIIPSGLRKIGDSAFAGGYYLTKVSIPDGVTTIGNRAFDGCWSLNSVTIPNSVTTIENYAFQACIHLTSVAIPNSVTSIGAFAFKNCEGLTSVTIPDSVTSIEVGAFSRCSKLESITILNSDVQIHREAFSCCKSLREIIIPKGSKPSFLQKDGIKDLEGGEYMLIEDESLSSSKTPFQKVKRADNNTFRTLLNDAKQPNAGIIDRIDKIFRIGFVVLWAFFLIVNAIYTWVANSWFSCVIWVIITVVVFYCLMVLVDKASEEFPIETKSPNAGSIAHLIWRIIWVLGLSIICEIIMMVIFVF